MEIATQEVFALEEVAGSNTQVERTDLGGLDLALVGSGQGDIFLA